MTLLQRLAHTQRAELDITSHFAWKRPAALLLLLVAMATALSATSVMIWWQKQSVVIAADSKSRRIEVVNGPAKSVDECKVRLLPNGLVFTAAGHYRPSVQQLSKFTEASRSYDAFEYARTAAASAKSPAEAADVFSTMIRPYFEERRRKLGIDTSEPGSRLARLYFCFFLVKTPLAFSAQIVAKYSFMKEMNRLR